MSNVFRGIVGVAFITAGFFAIGTHATSKNLSCQKIEANTANCFAESKTLAGWMDSRYTYQGIRSAQITLVRAPLRGKNFNSPKTIVEMHPLFLIDQAGYKSKLKIVDDRHEPTVTKIAQQANQFLQSTQTTISIDISGSGPTVDYTENGGFSRAGSGIIPGGNIIFGILFIIIGMIIILWHLIWSWGMDRWLEDSWPPEIPKS
jgi:hypothetical protein